MKQEIRERIETIRKGEVPEGYKETKVGIIPIEWGVVPINKVLKAVKNAVNVESNTEYREIGIKSHGKGIFHKKLVQGNKLGDKRVFWVEEKCFIVNIVFAWEQAVAITSENERGLIASHRFPMYKPKNDSIYLDYLLAFYKSPRGKFQLNLASPGGAGRNKTLGQKEFAQSLIPVPTIDEQKKIAKLFSVWDRAIELKRRLIEEKNEFKRGLMQKLLTGEIRFSGFNDEWKIIKLRNLVSKMQSGGTPKSSEDKYYNGKIPFVKINDISVAGKYLQKTTTNINEEGLKNSSSWLVPANSILYCMYASVGVLCINKIPVATSQAIINILPNNNVDLEYLYYFLLNHKTKISKLIETGTQGNINAGIVRDIQVNLPSIDEQKKISLTLSNQDRQIELLEKEVFQLKKGKKGLMQLLLTGIVRVEVN